MMCCFRGFFEKTIGLFQNDFWHGKREVGQNISPGKLCGYYNDLTHKTEPYYEKKSPEGVPLVKVTNTLNLLWTILSS